VSNSAAGHQNPCSGLACSGLDRYGGGWDAVGHVRTAVAGVLGHTSELRRLPDDGSFVVAVGQAVTGPGTSL
jgi:hypothetical protein